MEQKGDRFRARVQQQHHVAFVPLVRSARTITVQSHFHECPVPQADVPTVLFARHFRARREQQDVRRATHIHRSVSRPNHADSARTRYRVTRAIRPGGTNSHLGKAPGYHC
jgi:hypothetical protein